MKNISTDKADKVKGNAGVFLLILAVAFTVIIGCSVLLFNASKKSNISEQKSEAMYIARQVEHYILINKENLNISAKNIEHMLAEKASHQSIYEYMKRESKINYEVVTENFSGIYGWIDGEYLDGIDYVPESDYDAKSRPWYIDALANKGQIALVSPYIDVETGKVVFSLSKLLEDGESVLSLDITMEYLQRLCTNVVESGIGHLLITDKNGLIVACEDSNAIGVNIFNVEKKDKQIAKAIYFNKQKYSIPKIKYEGKSYLVFDQEIEGNWHAVTMIDPKYIYGNLWYVYHLCAIVILVAFLFIFLFYSKIYQEKNRVVDNNKKLTSIANIFLCMYELDLEKDSFFSIKTMPYYESMVNEYPGKLSEVLPLVMKVLVSEQSWEEVKKFVNVKTLKRRLKNENNISLEFVGVRHYARARFIVVKRDEKNDAVKVIYVIEDISEEIKKRNALQKAANTDKMTATLNRRAWESLLADIRERNSLSGISIFIFDINGLKNINDTYGHQKGDELIKSSVEFLKKFCSSYGDIYRLGGDEFGLISEKEITEVPEKLVAGFEEMQLEWNRDHNSMISISVGISKGFVDKYDSIDDLIKLADDRMYLHKEKCHQKM